MQDMLCSEFKRVNLEDKSNFSHFIHAELVPILCIFYEKPLRTTYKQIHFIDNKKNFNCIQCMYFFIFYPTAIAHFRRCGRCLSYSLNLKTPPDSNKL